MPTINIPKKGPGSTFEHGEANMIVDAINENYQENSKPSHELFSGHFKEDGTSGSGSTAVPIIKVNGALFDPDIFEMVGDVVTLKQSVKTLIGL